MMNPYARDLGTKDAIVALGETPERIRRLVSGMQEADFQRAYGPDKWTAAQLIEHIAEAEMIFSLRVRMALTHPDYVVQPYDQDKFLAREPKRSGREAFEVYDAVRRWNLPLYRSVTATERALTFKHPERGQLTVGDLLDTLAGHELHHLAQLEQIAR
jgi:uncharacterized damage-inducible protein DinB